MGEALNALENASRRELQALAKKLQLCRANAKSNVIVSHAIQFMDNHPKNGEQQVLDALGGSGTTVSVTSPVTTKLNTKKEAESRKQPEEESDKQPEDESDKQPEEESDKQPEEHSDKQPDDKSDKQIEGQSDKQPEDEPETKSASAATNRVMPMDKDKSKSKHVPFDTATITSPPIAAPSAKSSKPIVTASSLPKKSSTTTVKTQPTSVENKKVDGRKKGTTATTKSASISKKVEKDEPETKSASAATNRVMPMDKDKSKSKHVPFDTATITSPPIAAPSAKSSKPNVTASSLPKKSSTTTVKTQPTSVENKKVDGRKKDTTATTKSASISKKVESKKARKAVEALVKSVADLTFVGESRVRCSTTGHEMLADVNIINMYLHGKRYQKARNLKLSFAKYAPMFVDHPDESKTDMLWCNVTESTIARDEKRVQDHMTAPKYQKQLSSWKKHEAAKKKKEEEENERREARIQMAKRKRLEAAKEKDDNAVVSERPMKRKRLVTNLDK
ncbi:hypothetical protein DD237_004207 [Peronospora effusa]|uniref:Uncharacterized protein n=1 Tax=Peronospora effusa TaxID=542832 RepID=A0A425BY77_9STRA|nr:hypothetical protein DD237_004207 [Peronospora effusa]